MKRYFPFFNCESSDRETSFRYIFYSIQDTLMFSSPAWYFRWPIVFTMDLAARENIVIPVGVLLEIFVTPSLGVWHVQIATNGSGYQVKRCICFPRSFDSVHREKQNRSSNEHVRNGSERLFRICTWSRMYFEEELFFYFVPLKMSFFEKYERRFK